MLHPLRSSFPNRGASSLDPTNGSIQSYGHRIPSRPTRFDQFLGRGDQSESRRVDLQWSSSKRSFWRFYLEPFVVTSRKSLYASTNVFSCQMAKMQFLRHCSSAKNKQFTVSIDHWDFLPWANGLELLINSHQAYQLGLGCLRKAVSLESVQFIEQHRYLWDSR